MSNPIINWDTPFGALKLSLNGTGVSDTIAVPQDVVDVFGEDNVRAAYVSKRMTGCRDTGCGTSVNLEHVFHPEAIVEVKDSEFIHAVKITRGDTVGWLALHMMERRSSPNTSAINSTPVRVEDIYPNNKGVSFQLRHDSACKIGGVVMLYATSSTHSLETIPSWFSKT